MAGMAVVAIHQRRQLLARRQSLACKRLASMGLHPAMQCGDINIGLAGHEIRPLDPSAATCGSKRAFLPMEKHLIVFQHLVVTNVLQPAGP